MTSSVLYVGFLYVVLPEPRQTHARGENMPEPIMTTSAVCLASQLCKAATHSHSLTLTHLHLHMYAYVCVHVGPM